MLIIFFSPWICWNTYWLPPWSGWWTLNDFLNACLNYSDVWSRERFILSRTEGGSVNAWARGTGTSIIGGTKVYGMMIFATNRSTIFYIINYMVVLNQMPTRSLTFWRLRHTGSTHLATWDTSLILRSFDPPSTE